MKKLFYFFLLITFFSCSNEDDFNDSSPIQIDYSAQNETEILAYLNDNNLTAQKTASGLYYIISSEGDGDFPSANSNVTLAYKGYFINGNIFDQSENATFSLTNLITGFSEGAQLLQEGGSGTFILPSSLGYGSQGNASIPGGAVIIFDIDLISIN